MSKYFFIAIFLVSALVSAQKIQVIEADCDVSFYFIDDEVDGTFDGFQFTGDVDLDDLPNSVFSGAIVTKTIDTNNWLRSRHLRARKFFNASDFPKIKFISSSVSGVKQGFQVVGTLNIKGIEKEVTWSFSNDGKRLVGTTQLNTRDFDISIHDKRERNFVDITLSLPYQSK